VAQHVEHFANQKYPAVLALLSASKLPQDFSIVFKRRLINNDRGLTIGARIYLSGDCLIKTRRMLDAVLIHEMAHVGQGYKWYRWFRTPRHWQEGIADFVRYKLGYTNGAGCPQCSVEFPHYTSGFWCAGAFLEPVFES
jgi:hypothetical protein